jgi:hypothetical protein
MEAENQNSVMKTEYKVDYTNKVQPLLGRYLK